MSTVADYQGRQVDVLAWDWPASLNGTVALTPTLAVPGGGGKIISGIGKLAQRFLLELLTEKGSMIYQPTRGTTFMAMLRIGAVRTTDDVEQLFYSALIDIQRNLLLDQLPTDPLDEQFANAILQNVTLTGDSSSITVYLTSQAGTGRAVLFPLSTTLTGA